MLSCVCILSTTMHCECCLSCMLCSFIPNQQPHSILPATPLFSTEFGQILLRHEFPLAAHRLKAITVEAHRCGCFLGWVIVPSGDHEDHFRVLVILVIPVIPVNGPRIVRNCSCCLIMKEGNVTSCCRFFISSSLPHLL